jgi:ABC-2 type transport system ATP-binding protein
MSDPAVLLEGLTKSYGRFLALRGVDLEVRRGEILGFLGPNGAGKTTTIRCMLDLIRPSGGVLRVLGLDPQKHSVAVRARTGYLPGELAFEGNMRVEAVLRYLASLRAKRVEWSRVQGLARRLDLDLGPPFKNLSKGNKQKVGVVQALMHRPELLLLDEPTSGLDPLMQKEVLRMIREARVEGATVFFSSHIIGEVEDLADRVAIIRDGQVAEIVAIQDMRRRSIRRAHVHLKQAVSPEVLAAISGVTSVARDEGDTFTLQVEGDMDELIKALAGIGVSEVETERVSLEETFMAYYAKGEAS